MNQISKMYRMYRRYELSQQEWWDFAATQDESEVRAIVENSMKAERRLRAYKESPAFLFKIRKYCNMRLYTDVRPYEVVKVISPKTVEVRPMEAKPITLPSDFRIGGFSAHCADNHSQTYEYVSNPDNPVVRIRLGKNGWMHAGIRFAMADRPKYFYDYNF